MWALRFCSLLFLCTLGNSQQIVTVAGLPDSHRTAIDGVAAPDAPLGNVYGILRDVSTGRLLIHDQYLVEGVESDGTLLAFAGNGRTNAGEGDVADGTPASNLRIVILRGMAQDAAGALYLADAGAGRVFRVGLDGSVTRFAGTPLSGADHKEVDGLPATSVPMSSPRGLAFDSKGNLYISEVWCQCIRRIDTAGVASTLYTLPTGGAFLYFEGLAVDAADNVYAVVYSGHEILKITPDGKATIIAGTGVPGFSGDGGKATFAQLQYPSDLALAADGTIYVSDSGNYRIRRIKPDGTIETLAGTGQSGFSGDGGPAASARMNFPAQLLLERDGTLYFGDFGNGRVRRITPDGIIGTIAGNGNVFRGPDAFPNGVPAISARLEHAAATAFDSFGNLYIADSSAYRVRKVTPDGNISTVVGDGNSGPFGDGGPATEAGLGFLFGLTVDSQNILYLATQDGRVRKVDTGGTISLVAGSGIGTGLIRYQGDEGPAVNATLNEPKGVAVDAAGNVYIADTSNARLRMVDRDGIIHLVAAADTSLLGKEYWNAVTFDPQGRIYVAITRAASGGTWSVVSRVNSDGSLTTVAGTGQACPNTGALDFTYDGQPATAAALCIITGITFDAQGNLYIPESRYGVLLKVTPDGLISRIAGQPGANVSGDGGPAMTAALNPPNVAIDGAGNFFFPDRQFSRIREITRTAVTLKVSRDRIDLLSGQTQTLAVSTNFAEPFPYIVRWKTDDGGAWLSANRTTGQTGEPIRISADTRGLARGTYQGTVSVLLMLPGGAQQVDIPVTVTGP